MTDEFDSPPTPASYAADKSLYVLERMRELKAGARVEFETFIAGSLAHHLTMVGADFGDTAIIQGVLAFRQRSPRLFYTAPELEYINARTTKPEPPTAKPRRPKPLKSKTNTL